MFSKLLWCTILIFNVIRGTLSYPLSDLFENFNVAKNEIPIQVTFENKTSLSSPNIVDSLNSGTHKNGLNIDPGDTDIPTIDNVTATTYSFKNETNVTDPDTTIPNFNYDDNYITDVNTEADLSLEYTTEFTIYTNTEDYENATILYDEEVYVLRAEVSPEILASLLG